MAAVRECGFPRRRFSESMPAMPDSASPSKALMLRSLPAVFVVLWATGFVGAIWGLPYAEPWTLLALRFGAVLAIALPLAPLLRFGWPDSWRQVGHIAVVGVLMHAVYLGGAYLAMARGLPAGLTALIVCLQPLCTSAIVGPILGERVSARQVLGLVLGLGGVVLVLSEKLSAAAGGGLFEGFEASAVVFATMSLAAMTLGIVYQKKFCTTVDIRSGTVIQYAAAGAAVGIMALLTERMEVTWTWDFVFALGWLVFGLSFGAVSLLMLMIRMGEASRIASFFYLVPPVTALLGYVFFGELLGPLALTGMAISVIGVAMVVRAPKRAGTSAARPAPGE
jgi:drug/metabolite transporter (DMT)-like permease